MKEFKEGDMVVDQCNDVMEIKSVCRYRTCGIEYTTDNDTVFNHEEVEDGYFREAIDLEVDLFNNLKRKAEIENTLAWWLFKRGYNNPIPMLNKLNDIYSFKAPVVIKTSDFYACEKEFETILKEYFTIICKLPTS